VWISLARKAAIDWVQPELMLRTAKASLRISLTR
jgi:hypothetical protein